MPNIIPPQFTHNDLPRRYSTANGQQPRGGVWQDNPSPPPASSASPQPAPLQKQTRAQLLNRKTFRTQNRHSYRKSAVKITSWVKPVIKQEIEKVARSEGLSISSLSASLLEKALQQNLYIRYAALIDPIIEKAIGKHMRAYSNRLAVLLVRSLFTSEQTRSIVTNILSRQDGMTQKTLETIITASDSKARGNITRITPQLKTLIEAVQKELAEEVRASG